MAIALAASGARADDARRPVDDDWPVQSTGPLAVDAGLLLALPATWQTGLSSGIGAVVTRGRRFARGGRGVGGVGGGGGALWFAFFFGGGGALPPPPPPPGGFGALSSSRPGAAS